MDSMRKRQLVAVVLLLAFIGSVAAYFVFRPEDRLSKAKETGKKLTEAVKEKLASGNLADLGDESKMREMGMELRDLAKDLSPDEQAELFASMAKNMVALYDAFQMLPKSMQNQILDKFILDMDKRRQQWEQRQANRNPGGVSGSASLQGQGSDPNRDEMRRRFRDPEKIERFFKVFLNHTTPEDRYKLMQAREMFRKRREELGLPPPRRGSP
ncbi:MAG: hypothetical protein KatS3mg105_3592 [Gemmatales bacterium]|nr:MAG: hypothetical protein KatS3mg105_3592 [Gemmatales bacterium]